MATPQHPPRSIAQQRLDSQSGMLDLSTDPQDVPEEFKTEGADWVAVYGMLIRIA